MSQNINILQNHNVAVMGENTLNERADYRIFLDVLLKKHPAFKVVISEPIEFQRAVKKSCLEGLVKGIQDFKDTGEEKSIYDYPADGLWYQTSIEPAVYEQLCNNSVVIKYWEKPEWAGKDHKEVQCGNLARVVSGTYPSFIVHRKDQKKWSPTSMRL